MSISKFPCKIIDEEIPQLFYYLSDKNTTVTPEVNLNNLFIEHSELDLTDECNKFCKLIGKNKYSSEILLKNFYSYVDSKQIKFNEIVHAKAYSTARKMNAYEDLSDLFESKESGNELLNEIDNETIEIRKYIENEKEKSKYSHQIILSKLIFIIINSEYIIKTINKKDLIFLNEKKEIINEDFNELIINLYNKSIELYVREINRIEKITKILDAIERSFIEYSNCKNAGLKKALIKFANFFEVKSNNKNDYQYKENKGLNFFLYFHQEYLYNTINTEIFSHIYKTKSYSLLNEFSRSESILIQNLEKITYNKVLVKKKYDANKKSLKILLDYQSNTKICTIKYNSTSKLFRKRIPYICDGDIDLKEVNKNYNPFIEKVDHKHKPYDILPKTFCDILSKFSITLMTEKKPEINSDKNIKPLTSTNITKMYDKKLIEMAFVGKKSLILENKIEITLEKLLAAFCDPNATDKNGCTALFWAAKKSHSDFVKDFLILVSHDTKTAHFDPNIQDKNGYTPLHAAIIGMDNVRTNTMNHSKESLVQKTNHKQNSPKASDKQETLKRLLKYSTINPNIMDNNFDTPLHIAAQLNEIELVKILLERRTNIDTSITNKAGKTSSEVTNNLKIKELIKEFANKKPEKNLKINHLLQNTKNFIPHKNPLKSGLELAKNVFNHH